MNTDAATQEVPFAQDNFKILIGIDADDGVVRMRAAVPNAISSNGVLDLADPAVFVGWWIQEHWGEVTNLAAGEYNARQALVAASAPAPLQLVSSNGGILQ